MRAVIPFPVPVENQCQSDWVQRLSSSAIVAFPVATVPQGCRAGGMPRSMSRPNAGQTVTPRSTVSRPKTQVITSTIPMSCLTISASPPYGVDVKIIDGAVADAARVRRDVQEATETLSQAGINVQLRSVQTIPDPGGLLVTDVTWRPYPQNTCSDGRYNQQLPAEARQLLGAVTQRHRRGCECLLYPEYRGFQLWQAIPLIFSRLLA